MKNMLLRVVMHIRIKQGTKSQNLLSGHFLEGIFFSGKGKKTGKKI